MLFRLLLNQLKKISFINVLTHSGPSTVKNTTSSHNIQKIVVNASYWHSPLKQYGSLASNIPTVSYEDIKELPKRQETILIDVREPQELQETGQIPTSINIPLGQVAEELAPTKDKDSFKLKYGRDKPKFDTEIIFHCKIGKRSQNAAEMARALGYQNIKNYLGSWAEWAEKEGLPK